MLETIPGGLVYLDEEFRFLYLNPAAERILGQPREELIGEVLWEKAAWLRGTELERQLRRVVEEGSASELEGECAREGGFYQVLISRCEAGAMVLLREASEKKELQDALQESEAWRRLIIQNIRDFAIFSMDPAGRVSLWNPGAERMFGYTEKEMLGERSDPLFVPEERKEGAADRELAEAVEEGYAREERWHMRKDGTRLFVSGALVPLYDPGGRLRGFTKVARDITDRKQVEDELLTARQHLEEVVAERTARLQQTISELEVFSYSVSHDLRAPLRAMRSFAQIVARTTRDKLDERSADYLDRIVLGADRLDRLIQDVLAYSRVGRSEIEVEPVELESLVETIIREHPSLDPAEARIQLERPLETVMGHKASLSQCISNLLTNAVKFVAPGVFPEVRVKTERPGGRVRLWVEDNGIGIPEEHRARIFGVFHRAPEGRRYEGTGIGLAIVQRAVAAMGGAAGVEPGPNGGSRFWVELPGAGKT
jgi:PAS domain S-box-containing protein